MSNPFVVLLIVLLAAVTIYLLISFGVFGSAVRAGRSGDDDDTSSKQEGA